MAAAGPVGSPRAGPGFCKCPCGRPLALCLYLLFMIAVLTRVFLGRGEKTFEIKMFRNYFTFSSVCFLVLSPPFV